MTHVTVIITTYKRSVYLERAIKSVINQKYKCLEVIVVDDNDEGEQREETKRILRKFNTVRLITNSSNQGACYSRNVGAEQALGDVLMFLDDDDYYLPDKVSMQISVFEDPEIDACLCAMKRYDENNNEIVTEQNFPRGDDLKSFIINGNCFTSMIAIRKEIFMKLGGFSEISRFQDKFFMYKFFENECVVKFLNEELFVMLEHSNERISLNNIDRVSKAIEQIYSFERQHAYLFQPSEIKFLRRRYYLMLATVRFNGNFSERIKGLKYLLFSGENLRISYLLRLIFSTNSIDKIKRLVLKK